MKAGVVYLGEDQSILQNLPNDDHLVRRALRIPYRVASPGAPGLCYQCAFESAKRVLGTEPRSDKRLIAFVGGILHEASSSGYDDWIRAARRAKATSDLLIVGCG